MTKEGKMLLESDAYKIRYISTDDNAYYIALCKHGKGPKTIHILDYYTGKEVFSSTVSKEEYTMYTSLGLVLIQNADNKYMLINKETMKPIFKDWKKDIIILDSFGWYAVKENDNMYVICDQEGKKSLVRRKFIKVKRTYHFNTCYVEYYIKGKVQTGYLDLCSGKIRKNF